LIRRNPSAQGRVRCRHVAEQAFASIEPNIVARLIGEELSTGKSIDSACLVELVLALLSP